MEAQPLLYYVVLSAVLSACLYLFISAKADLRRAEKKLAMRVRKNEDQIDETILRVDLVSSKVDDCEKRMNRIDEAVQRPTLSVVHTSGPTNSKRSTIVQMAQKGERPEAIAAVVGLPKNEVDLLMKVHRAVSGVR